MQHSGADHQVERASNLPDALDRELMEFEVLEIILALKIARVAQARVTDVDCGDSRIGLAKRVPRGLRGAASGNQDFLSSPRLLGRPHQMELGPATVWVLVVVAVYVQTCAWRRIGHPFVEVADFLAAAHLGPPRISGLSARPWPLNIERHWRQAKSLPPEAECRLSACRRRFRASSSTRRRG
jgi:hypothetical protein